MKQPQASRKRKPSPRKATVVPARFFEKELAGEQAPSFDTMQILFARSAELLSRAPWDLMTEDNLVVFGEPGGAETCFCSVMGAAGQSMTVQVYIGNQSYFWFQRLHEGEPTTIGEYFARQHSVYVDFTDPIRLTPPERQLAKAMHHPLSAKTVAPMFRAIHPGYHPWYVTEREAKILAAGIEAVLVVHELLEQNPEADFWNSDDGYPFVSCVSKVGDQHEFRVKRVDAPRETVAMPKLPDLDQARIQSIADQHFPSEGVIEVDQFYGAGMIGEKYERKACFRVALAIDAKTAFAFPAEVSTPEQPTGELLAEVVLKAIECKRALPAEVQVRDPEFKILLDRLAQALGFGIRVKKNLPALDFAKSQLQAMMGDPGVIQ